LLERRSGQAEWYVEGRAAVLEVLGQLFGDSGQHSVVTGTEGLERRLVAMLLHVDACQLARVGRDQGQRADRAVHHGVRHRVIR
jgi:hypothetical protein